jgi:hypothetical protein
MTKRREEGRKMTNGDDAPMSNIGKVRKAMKESDDPLERGLDEGGVETERRLSH